MDKVNIEDIRRAMTEHRICVVIPTYNNAGTLGSVISEVLEYSPDVIVVNDGSTDATPEIIAGFGDAVDVVSYADNKGKGTALKRGFRRAVGRGFEYAITIDSDGQHYASDLPNFVKAIAEHPGALIVGERDLSNVDINGKSSFANKFSNFWFAVQTGRRLRDTQTGYRAYPLRRLHGLRLLTSRYEAELELLVFAAWHGVELVSIKINVYYPPQAERVSHFRPALDFTRISILNTILCVLSVVYGLPVRTWMAVRQKQLFAGEFKKFTHKNGQRREAAVTLARIGRAAYGLAYTMSWLIFVFTPLVKLFFTFGNVSEQRRLKLHHALRWISHFLVVRFPAAKVVYENKSNETFDKPALIVCNHQSHLDLPVLMATHSKLIFLTNDWVWNSKFYGRIIHQAEFLPVSAGMEVILPQLRDLVRRGYSIVIFPEGTRSADCKIRRFHQGAFYLANELELDIVPMTLHGAGHYLPKNDPLFRNGFITLRTLDRVPYRKDDYKSMLSVASSFRKIIMTEYDSIARKTEKAGYFKGYATYKYAWRGWWVVSECKSTLRRLPELSKQIDNEPDTLRTVRVVNSGTGVFALLYALVNKKVEVYAFEENVKKHRVAAEMAELPPNLHYVHAVWPSDYEPEGVDFDKTITLDK